MPLVRYEVRCEHSLANPELYRSAARDDSEGLLEGVAMAGLVGIVRQLGDLAEFAAEIFRDLHDELMAIGGHGHDLMVRLQQLEAELPVVEKALLSEPNQLRFAYSAGSDWHAAIRNDQNHCTQGDLPRFIRHFYEECRGPPRLFLLDKFDVAGAAGACLKRYTDPSFFKLEWASSELMKAQRAQRDKKSRREKRRGRLRSSGQPKGMTKMPSRVRYGSASLEDFDGLPHHLTSSLKLENATLSHVPVSHHAGSHQWRSTSATRTVDSAEESSATVLRPTRGASIKADIVASEAGLMVPPQSNARDHQAVTTISGKLDKTREIKEDQEVKNQRGEAADLNETKNGYEAVTATNASILVELEDSPVTNMLMHEIRQTSKEGTELTTSGDQTSGVNLSEDLNSTGMGSLPSMYLSKEDGGATNMADKTSWRNSEEESEAVLMMEKLTRHSLNKGGGKAAHISAEALIHVPSDANNAAPGKFLRQSLLEIKEAANTGGGRFSQQSSIEDGDNFADALTTMGSDEFDFEGGIRGLPVGENSEAAETDRGLNHSIPEGQMESLQEIPNQTGIPMEEEELESMHPLETLSLAHLNSDVTKEPKHETSISPSSLHQTSPVSGTVSGGPSTSSTSSTECEGPMVELDHSLDSHEEGTLAADIYGRESINLIPGRRDSSTSDAHHGLDVSEVLQVLEVSDVYIEEIFDATPDQGDESHVLTLKTASQTLSSHDSSYSATSSPTTWMPGKSILEPSVSNLSRLSYASSSLIPVSSYSAPSTPSTPRSPVLNVLVSLPKSPLSRPQETHGSLWDDCLELPCVNGSSSHQSDLSSPIPTKSPVLSLPPLSFTLPSPPSVPPFEQEEASPANSTPLKLTTPSQIPNIADTGSNLFHGSLLPNLYPLPNFPGFSEPDPQHSLVNSPPDQECSPSPVSAANQESTNQLPLEARVEIQTSTSSKLEMDIPLSLQKNTSAAAGFSGAARPTLILRPNPADSPKSSGLSSPLPIPQHSVPGPSAHSLVSSDFTELPGEPASSGLPSQGSSPGGYMWNFPESSAPASPTGSVIIKDTPSLPASPVSDDSHRANSVPGVDIPLSPHIHSLSSPSAQHDLDAETTHGEKLDFEDGHCAQDIALLEIQESISGTLDLTAQKSLGANIDFHEERSKPSTGLRTGEILLGRLQSTDLMDPSGSLLHLDVNTEVNILTSSTLIHGVQSPCSPPSYRSDSLPHLPLSPALFQTSSALRASSGTRTILPVQRAESSFQHRSPPLLDAHPSSSAEINARSESSFQDGSPPSHRDPLLQPLPQESLLPTGDVSSNLQWQGKPNPPLKAEFILPSELPVQSETNSPPHSPPHSVFSESSSQLRWRSRSEPVFAPKLVIPNFSLPPNLAPTPHSRSSSCSPPPSETNSHTVHVESHSPLASPSSPIVSTANFPLEQAVSHYPAGRLQYEPKLECPSSLPAESEVHQSPLVRQDALLSSKFSEESLSDLVSHIPVRTLSNDELQGASSQTGLSHLPLEEFTSKLHPPIGPDPETSLHLRESPSQSIKLSESANRKEAIDSDFNPLSDSQLAQRNHHIALELNQVLDLIEPAAVMTTHVKKSIQPPPPPSAGGFALRKTPETRDALAAAIAAHDRSMLMKVAFKEPVIRPLPLPDERQAILEQIRTKSFNLRHTQKEKKEPVVRPVTNINVAAILEKANAIRQALAGSDEEDDEEDDWSDT